MEYSDNKKWLIVIGVMLIAIFSAIFLGSIQDNQDRENIRDMIENVGDEAEEFQEEVKDEIYDNTTDRR